jgi:hypothetical protein
MKSLKTMRNTPNILDGIKMQAQELQHEIKELEELIQEYKTDGLRVNEYLLAKVEILKTQLAKTK